MRTHIYLTLQSVVREITVVNVRVPTGPPDRHRQASRAGHAWRWPMQLFLSLLIAFPTCWRHSLRFPAPISGNLYSKRYFPVMGAPAPFHSCVSQARNASRLSGTKLHPTSRMCNT